VGLYGDSPFGGGVGPGRRLGRYELVTAIGEGGMGRVWAARMEGSHGFKKVVAIKTLSPTVASDPEAERMFLNEAHLASQIRHRNVVEILDLGEQDGVIYIVMEWVDGESLQRILRVNGKAAAFDPSLAARIAADAAAGLHAAHELHDETGRRLAIIHRDVSPQNILVGRDGTVKVVDFGIAKALGNLNQSTRTGELKGKLSYMSPEQVNAQPIDRRSDIFALGVVLFEMVTGARPFVAEHDIAVLQMIAKGRAPRPRSIDPRIPAELEDIVMTALATEVDARFQTAEQLSLALEHFLTRSGQVVTAAHLATLVRDRCGSKIDAARKRIVEPTPGKATEVLLQTPSSDLSSSLPRRTSFGPGGETRRAALTRGAPWMVAAGAVALASMAVFALRTHADPRSEHGPSVRDAAHAGPIAVRVNPPAARVMVGGALAGAGDQLVARPPPGARTEVLVALDGYTTATIELTSDGPDELHVELMRAPVSPPKEVAAPPPTTAAPAPPTPRPRPHEVERPPPPSGPVSVPKNPY
jgi:serine/threonine protein kinase